MTRIWRGRPISMAGLDGRRRCRRCGCGSCTCRRRRRRRWSRRCRPRPRGSRHGLVGRLEEVHDLVAQLGHVLAGLGGDVAAAAGPVGGTGAARPAGAGTARPSTTWSRASSSSRNPAPPASTTPASFSTGSSSGVLSRDTCPASRVRARTSTSGVPPSAAARAASADFADDGEDGALDRALDRLVRELGCPGEGGGQHVAVDGVVVAHDLGHASQQLGQDHPRVAPGPHERAVGDGLAHGGHVAAVDAGDRLAHRPEGEGHVRAGVAVGDGVDVEAVDGLLVLASASPKTAMARPSSAAPRRSSVRRPGERYRCRARRPEAHAPRGRPVVTRRVTAPGYGGRTRPSEPIDARCAVSAGCDQVVRPGSGDGVIITDTDLAEYDLAPGALEGSVFRMLRQGQRVVFDTRRHRPGRQTCGWAPKWTWARRTSPRTTCRWRPGSDRSGHPARLILDCRNGATGARR